MIPTNRFRDKQSVARLFTLQFRQKSISIAKTAAISELLTQSDLRVEIPAVKRRLAWSRIFFHHAH